MRKFIAACILIAISSVALSIYGQARIDKCADNKVEVAGVIRSLEVKSAISGFMVCLVLTNRMDDCSIAGLNKLLGKQ